MQQLLSSVESNAFSFVFLLDRRLIFCSHQMRLRVDSLHVLASMCSHKTLVRIDHQTQRTNGNEHAQIK